LLACGLLQGCASLVPQTIALRETWPAGVARQAELTSVPFFAQAEYECGPAALATVLVHSGVDTNATQLSDAVFLPGRRGSLQVEMLAATRRFQRVGYRINPQFSDLLTEVAAGNPVVVLQDTGLGFNTNWHYAVVVGFDYARGDIYLRSGVTERQVLPFTVFEMSWKAGSRWAMVVTPLNQVPATATEQQYLTAVGDMARVGDAESIRAAYAATVRRWPQSVAASIALANTLYERGDLAGAERELRRSAAINTDSPVVLNNLAQTLSDLGRNDEALLVIVRAKRAAGDSATYRQAIDSTHALIAQRLALNR
jgi:tetratricopeptide (TPR) repeat protein